MPTLIPDILADVLIQCLKKDNDSRTLGKFMLAGREVLHAAINYFKKAKFVEIYDRFLRVYVKIGRITHKHKISYQFSMINLIMKVLGLSIDEFFIYSCPQNFDVIEYFLEKKIKKVAVRQSRWENTEISTKVF